MISCNAHRWSKPPLVVCIELGPLPACPTACLPELQLGVLFVPVTLHHGFLLRLPQVASW